MAWVFQGNPRLFDIDDYVTRYPELIYWRTPRHESDIAVGDRAFIWRSGPNAGAIAIGSIVEIPTPGTGVKHPEALGSDLWRAEEPDPNEPRTGIHLDEIRLTAEEGFLRRAVAKEDIALAGATLITMPNGTVFPLNDAQTQAIERLWGLSSVQTIGMPAGVTEGERTLRSHYRRERSSSLRAKKLAEVHTRFGKYICALCGTDDSAYPKQLGQRIFEVHHVSPLAAAATPVRTTLDDLSVLCASCHRAVHASIAVEDNFTKLAKHFRGER